MTKSSPSTHLAISGRRSKEDIKKAYEAHKAYKAYKSQSFLQLPYHDWIVKILFGSSKNVMNISLSCLFLNSARTASLHLICKPRKPCRPRKLRKMFTSSPIFFCEENGCGLIVDRLRETTNETCPGTSDWYLKSLSSDCPTEGYFDYTALYHCEQLKVTRSSPGG